jgi:hypothetical protein
MGLCSILIGETVSMVGSRYAPGLVVVTTNNEDDEDNGIVVCAIIDNQNNGLDAEGDEWEIDTSDGDPHVASEDEVRDFIDNACGKTLRALGAALDMEGK